MIEDKPKSKRGRKSKTVEPVEETVEEKSEESTEEAVEEVKDEAPFEVKEEPEEVIVEDNSEPVRRVRRTRKVRA